MQHLETTLGDQKVKAVMGLTINDYQVLRAKHRNETVSGLCYTVRIIPL